MSHSQEVAEPGFESVLASEMESCPLPTLASLLLPRRRLRSNMAVGMYT